MEILQNVFIGLCVILIFLSLLFLILRLVFRKKSSKKVLEMILWAFGVGLVVSVLIAVLPAGLSLLGGILIMIIEFIWSIKGFIIMSFILLFIVDLRNSIRELSKKIDTLNK